MLCTMCSYEIINFVTRVKKKHEINKDLILFVDLSKLITYSFYSKIFETLASKYAPRQQNKCYPKVSDCQKNCS